MGDVQITGWPRMIAFGIVAGLLFGVISLSMPRVTFQSVVITRPAAYQLPKIPGATSLRMAMIHDVLLDRYLHHGSAWYTRRNDLAREVITKAGSSTAPEVLDALDDLAVGLEFLHQSNEAAAVMRQKLALLPPMQVTRVKPFQKEGIDKDRQELQKIIAAAKLPPEMQHQYTARANLGTSLIHGSFAKALAGDAEAKHQFAEGIGYIDQSIDINPGAHFGREKWQAIIARHFLACMDDPPLFTKFDMVGLPLEQDPVFRARAGRWYAGSLSKPAAWLDAHATLEERLNYRSNISPIEPSPEWAGALHIDLLDRVPFDEPTLALMGMWMLGGGPNPHSALALAHIAEAVGQLEIAWDGYERAQELQSAFPADETIRSKLIIFCRQRQAYIARAEAPENPEAWTTSTRERHVAELAWAHTYMDEYHAWEAAQIAAGVPLTASTFYDGFFKTHPPIASPVGQADESQIRKFSANGVVDALPLALLGAGTFMLLAAISEKRRHRASYSPLHPSITP